MIFQVPASRHAFVCDNVAPEAPEAVISSAELMPQGEKQMLPSDLEISAYSDNAKALFALDAMPTDGAEVGAAFASFPTARSSRKGIRVLT